MFKIVYFIFFGIFSIQTNAQDFEILGSGVIAGYIASVVELSDDKLLAVQVNINDPMDAIGNSNLPLGVSSTIATFQMFKAIFGPNTSWTDHVITFLISISSQIKELIQNGPNYFLEFFNKGYGPGLDLIYELSLLKKSVTPTNLNSTSVWLFADPKWFSFFHGSDPTQFYGFYFTVTNRGTFIRRVIPLKSGTFIKKNLERSIQLIPRNPKQAGLRNAKPISLTSTSLNSCELTLWDPTIRSTFLSLGFNGAARLGVYTIPIHKKENCLWAEEIVQDLDCWIQIEHENSIEKYLTHFSEISDFPLPVFELIAVGCKK